LLAVAGLAGCSHLVTSIDHPGDRWQRVDSENFRITTDAPAVHYKFVAARLENMDRAIKQVFFPGLKTPPLDVLFLADETLFMDLVDNVDLIAAFVPGAGKEGVLVIRSGEGEDDEAMAGLGVASHIVSHGIPRAPPWMHLGFSSFLQTAIVRNDGEAVFGQPPESQAVEILEGRLLPLAELERASWRDMNGPETRRHYATAWAFVHYMAVGGTRQVRQELFNMMALAASGNPDEQIRLPIARYEDGFRDYALKTFAGKPTVQVFVEQLGALSPPALKVAAAPEPEVRGLLQAVKAARARR
jgi:hypothetical protein